MQINKRGSLTITHEYAGSRDVDVKLPQFSPVLYGLDPRQNENGHVRRNRAASCNEEH